MIDWLLLLIALLLASFSLENMMRGEYALFVVLFVPAAILYWLGLERILNRKNADWQRIQLNAIVLEKLEPIWIKLTELETLYAEMQLGRHSR